MKEWGCDPTEPVFSEEEGGTLEISVSLRTCMEKRLCEDATGQWSSVSQQEISHQDQNLPAPQSGTSSLQNCGKTNFCHLGHPVCGIVFMAA